MQGSLFLGLFQSTIVFSPTTQYVHCLPAHCTRASYILGRLHTSLYHHDMVHESHNIGLQHTCLYHRNVSFYPHTYNLCTHAFIISICHISLVHWSFAHKPLSSAYDKLASYICFLHTSRYHRHTTN